jgi:hypothetical protein
MKKNVLLGVLVALIAAIVFVAAKRQDPNRGSSRLSRK